uniref:Uncharacterized protein n=1 Tax=Solanum lycopersicum TaxID=4081 RepID=A0A3Q7ITE5_SOLLC
MFIACKAFGVNPVVFELSTRINKVMDDLLIAQHAHKGRGGILWFQNLTEFPNGVLGPVFPLLIAGLHYINVQVCAKDNTKPQPDPPENTPPRSITRRLEVEIFERDLFTRRRVSAAPGSNDTQAVSSKIPAKSKFSSHYG